MAEFDLFLTRDDCASFMDLALRSGFTLYSGEKLDRPEPKYIHALADVEKHSPTGNFSLFLGKDSFARFPLKFRPFTREGRQYWFMLPSEVGPLLDFHFWASYEEHGTRRVARALLAYPSRVFNPHEGRNESAGPEIKREFQLLRSALCRQARVVKANPGRAYVTPAANAQIAKGWKLRPPFEAIEAQ